MTQPLLIPDDAPRLVTTRTLASWLGVARPTLHRWVCMGLLPPPIRLSERICLWDVVAIRKIMAERQGGLYPIDRGREDDADKGESAVSAARE